MSIVLIILLTVFDAIFYGYIHEKKNWLSKSLFSPYEWGEHLIYPYYRLVQGTLDIISIYLVYKTGIVNLIGFLIAWYLMVKEYGYYLVLKQTDRLKEFENTDVYWLKRIWFIGFFIFRPSKLSREYNHLEDYGFRKWKFEACFYLGVFILAVSNLI